MRLSIVVFNTMRGQAILITDCSVLFALHLPPLMGQKVGVAATIQSAKSQVSGDAPSSAVYPILATQSARLRCLVGGVLHDGMARQIERERDANQGRAVRGHARRV